MSRHELDEQNQSNPANLRLTWSSAESSFKCYDCTTQIKSLLNNVEFAILEESTSVCGFHEAQNLGIFSNEVKNLKTQALSVRTKNGVIIEGYYADIKDKWGKGPAFCKNVYVQLKSGEIASIQLSGAALKAYFDFREANRGKITKNWIGLSGVNALKKGSVSYNVPIFDKKALISAKEDVSLNANYEIVNNYLKAIVDDAPPMTETGALDKIIAKASTEDIPY